MGSLGPRKDMCLQNLLTSLTRSLPPGAMQGHDGSMVQEPMLVFDPMTSMLPIAIEWRNKRNSSDLASASSASLITTSAAQSAGNLSKVYVEAFIASRLRAHQQAVR